MSDLHLPGFDEEPSESPWYGDMEAPTGNDRRARRRWFFRIGIGLAVVMALVVGLGGYYIATGLNALQSLKRDPSLFPTDEVTTATVPVTQNGPMNFLLVGSDARAGLDGQRSDALIVAHLNATRDHLYLISIPRDSYVDIPDHSKNKINAALAFGGMPLTVKTVQNLVGVSIDHIALIDFEGFISLTNDVGGVTVFNETASSNLGFDFPRGNITISGEQALAYVRQRHDLPGGDFDRAARQRAVVKALVLKLMKPSVIANPVTFASVTGKLSKDVTVDDKLTNDVIWQLATSLNFASGSDSIRQIQVPIASTPTLKGVGSVDLIDETRMAKLVTALQTDQLAAYWQEYGED